MPESNNTTQVRAAINLTSKTLLAIQQAVQAGLDKQLIRDIVEENLTNIFGKED